MEMMFANPAGSFMQGMQFGHAANKMRNANVMDGYSVNALSQADIWNRAFNQHGPAYMAGDPNAANALAQTDYKRFLELEEKKKDREREDTAWDWRKEDRDLAKEDRERVNEREDTRWKWEMEDRAKAMKAEEIAAEREQLEGILSGAAHFYDKNDPEGYAAFLQANQVDPAQYPFDHFPAYAARFDDVLKHMKYLEEKKAKPAPISPPGKIAADVEAGWLPPGTPTDGDAKPSGAEAEISRIMELTNPQTGKPYTRPEAIRVADLVTVAQDGSLISKETGAVITPSPEPIGEGGFTPEDFGDPNAVLGPLGIGLNAANNLLDMARLDPASPAALKARETIKSLSTQTMLVLSEDFPGRPSNLTRERIEELTLKPNEFFQGPAGARQKIQTMSTMIFEAAQRAKAVAESRTGFTAEQRAKARIAYERLIPLARSYDSLMKAMEGPTPADGAVTSGGVQWKVVE